MRRAHLTCLFCGLVCVVVIGCGGVPVRSNNGAAGAGGGAGDAIGSGTSGSGKAGAGGDMSAGAGGGAKAGSGGNGSSGSSGANAGAGGSGAAGSGTSTSGNALPKAGNPDGSCSSPLPSQAQPVDTSKPTTVVGTGTAASCTFDKLASAVATGGIITFNCGDTVATIPVTATLELKTDRNTVIDGGNKIILDGGGKVRILHWYHGDYQVNTNGLTLQHIELINGKATPTMAIPTCPSPCSQGYNDGEGGALYMRDGLLRVIDATFANNQAAELGPDTGGGAIYITGAQPAYIASSTFRNNHASNAGGFGSLQAGTFIYNSLFEGNSAVGNGANNNDASKCSCKNNNQNEIGSGGNGGAIYNDGASNSTTHATVDVTICGTQVRNNTSNAFGPALFFTSNDGTGTLRIQDSLMYNNLSRDEGTGWQWKPGISTNAKTLDPINSDIR